MKVLYSALGGAIQLQEEAGVISLVWNESLGGGAAAGIIEGEGKIKLKGMDAIKLGEAMINAHLSEKAKPLALVVEGIANQAIAALE